MSLTTKELLKSSFNYRYSFLTPPNTHPQLRWLSLFYKKIWNLNNSKFSGSGLNDLTNKIIIKEIRIHINSWPLWMYVWIDMLKISFSFKGFASPSLLLLAFYSTHIPTCLSIRPSVRLSRAKYSCPFVAFYLYHSLSLSFISLVSDMLSFVRVSCPFVRSFRVSGMFSKQ